MHDIRFIREYPDQFDAAMGRRKIDISASSILEMDTVRRALQSELQEMQSRRNVASKEIGKLKANGGDADALIAEVNDIKTAMPDVENREAELAKKLASTLMEIPNILDASVPDGDDETENELIRSHGDIPSFGFTPVDHVALGEGLGQMDFALGAKLAGARFVVLQGQLARLERALAALMLDTHTSEFGYVETVPPSLVNSRTMTGTGQLPKFAEDSYKTTNGWWLIPTSEVTLTNTVAGQNLPESDLPIRLTAHTLCFRSEAGSAGKDTSGMLRQHQFEKVEMVSITHPDESLKEHSRMTKCAQAILEKLGLPYRIVLLCTGDMGFGARKTHDLEVWLPGQKKYREISSVSICGDFQARRMLARFKPADGGKLQFVHTLNGSGVAVGRCLIAILENGQNEDGSISLPPALSPYLNNCSQISSTGHLE